MEDLYLVLQETPRKTSQIPGQVFQNLFTPIHIYARMCLILNPELRVSTQPLGSLLAMDDRNIIVELPIPKLNRQVRTNLLHPEPPIGTDQPAVLRKRLQALRKRLSRSPTVQSKSFTFHNVDVFRVRL